MGLARPTGEYAEQMLEPDGWPAVDEDAYFDRAQEYTRVLRQVTDVLENCRHQQGEIFDGGVWSGGAAGAANGELGMIVGELATLQGSLATVITWHRYIAGSIIQAKSDITDNVEGTQKYVEALENDSSLDAAERTAAINTALAATYGANHSLMTATADQILASKAWKPPNNALRDLLDQKTPPPPVILPDTPVPVTPPAREDRPRPGPTQPAPVNPVIPPPVSPGMPPPVPPGGPTTGVPPGPTPGAPPSPGQPATPAPTPVAPGPSAPGGPTAPGGGPAAPLAPATPAASLGPAASTPTQGGGGGKGMAPASAASPSSGTRSEDSSSAAAPAAAAGMPAAPMAPGASGGGGARPGASSGAGPKVPVEQKPAAKSPGTRPAAAGKTSARRGPATRPESPDDSPPAEAAAMAPIPVSAARLERDAVADAATAEAARRAGPDPLQLARRIAAALNAPGGRGAGDLGFFWVTGLTTGGEIVVANSYGLAYIPDGVQLPEQVQMATADEAIPAAERARWATYPVMAVQGWAEHHDTKLRAVIATEEQLANSDPGAPKVVLKPDDIPDSGEMIGRSPLEVVDPEAAERLAATPDPRLVSLLPPAPADASSASEPRPTSEVLDPQAAARVAASLAAGKLDPTDFLAQLPDLPAASEPPADRRAMLWFDVVKPMASKAAGREIAHLRAFRIYAAHAQEVLLREAHTAVDLVAQREAVADWLYWKHLSGLLDAALAKAS
ncbi:hypothetical protein AWB92_24120 [Mycobacterium sp. IEC1808]|uniref:hypothetical protein n=1 Tax=Mycobacterium sp. IEC1808 TaxID=1743230 RepID=UPI000A14DEC8|nr:hypothetical protein [Mycobacterium sp. IEC1808]ORW87513.1 hypothetical protein AWB92_24120 [Mycobacterium sp. IEC1808]